MQLYVFNVLKAVNKPETVVFYCQLEQYTAVPPASRLAAHTWIYVLCFCLKAVQLFVLGIWKYILHLVLVALNFRLKNVLFMAPTAALYKWVQINLKHYLI